MLCRNLLRCAVQFKGIRWVLYAPAAADTLGQGARQWVSSKWGAYFAERRKASRLTQENVADRLGASRGSVQNWEYGQQVPEGEYLLRLCDLIGADIREVQRLYLGREPQVQHAVDDFEARVNADLAAGDREFFGALMQPIRALLRRGRHQAPDDE